MLVPSHILWIQFNGFIDLDSYDTIAMRLRGDGRCYISTVSFYTGVAKIWPQFSYLTFIIGFFNFNWIHTELVWQLLLMQIYTENWINSPGQQEDNSWQAFVFVPKDQWHIAKASFLLPLLLVMVILIKHYSLIAVYASLQNYAILSCNSLSDPSRSIFTNMERQCDQHKGGDESITHPGHVSFCQCGKWHSGC